MTKQIFAVTLFLITLCAIAIIAFPSDAQADTRYVEVGGTEPLVEINILGGQAE